MKRSDRWDVIEAAASALGVPSIASAIHAEVRKGDWQPDFGSFYTDLGRMALDGRLVETALVDAGGRERRAFSVLASEAEAEGGAATVAS